MGGEDRVVPDGINEECVLGVDLLDGFGVDAFAGGEDGDAAVMPDYAFVEGMGGARQEVPPDEFSEFGREFEEMASPWDRVADIEVGL